MDDEMRRMVRFVKARLVEDAAIAEAAVPGFDVEATSHMTSTAHAEFVRRFGPGWVTAEVFRKTVVVDGEVAHAAVVEEVAKAPYVFPWTRVLASAWRDHPDFEEGWLRSSA